MKHLIVLIMIALFVPHKAAAQFNTDRLMVSGRSALYYEDYVLSIQYFNQVLTAKPYLYEPWFFLCYRRYGGGHEQEQGPHHTHEPSGVHCCSLFCELSSVHCFSLFGGLTLPQHCTQEQEEGYLARR